MWIKTLLSISLLLICTFVLGQEKFQPSSLTYGNGKLVSLKSNISALKASLPAGLHPFVKELIVWRNESADDLHFAAHYASSENTIWECVQYRLLQEEFILSVYGSSWEAVGLKVLSIMGSDWGLEDSCLRVFQDSSRESEYLQYRESVERLVLGGLELVDQNDCIKHIYIEEYGGPIVVIKSSGADVGITNFDSFGVREIFGRMYGGSIVPGNCADSLKTGDYVFLRYTEKSIDLVFTVSNPSEGYIKLHVIVRSPQPIIIGSD